MLTVWQKTPGLTERLAALRQSHSARQIAKALSDEFNIPITRCQVIGKSQRMKLTPRELPKPKYIRPSRARIVSPPIAPPAMPPSSRLELARMRVDALPIVQLKTNGCRYLYGDYPFACCTEDRTEGSSYCVWHHQKAHLPPLDYARRRA